MDGVCRARAATKKKEKKKDKKRKTKRKGARQSQRRTVSALSMVSAVVKVLLTTTTSVCAGSRSAVAR